MVIHAAGATNQRVQNGRDDLRSHSKDLNVAVPYIQHRIQGFYDSRAEHGWSCPISERRSSDTRATAILSGAGVVYFQ